MPNGDDCAPADPFTLAEPVTVGGVMVDGGSTIGWDDQSPTSGASIRYDILGGELSTLQSVGIGATTCVADDLQAASHVDGRPDPPSGDGYFYLIRARNPCGVAGLGDGREALESLDCAAP